MLLKNKKLIYIILIISIFFLLIIIPGCESSKNDNVLSTPMNLSITDDDYLIWDNVPNASGYTITIKDSNDQTKICESTKNKLDLFELICDYGEYRLSVFAHSTGGNFLESDDSNEISYVVKDYSSMVSFIPISSKSEYSISIVDLDIDGKLVIPEFSPNGYRVTKVQTIINCVNVDSIYIPNSITEIGVISKLNHVKRIRYGDEVLKMSSIQNCDLLEEISFPVGVKEFTKGIMNCQSLKTIHFGKNISLITGGTIQNCDNLEQIIIDSDNPKYYSSNNYIIERDTKRIVAGVIDKPIPEEVIEIGDNAFFKSENVETFTIPGHIKKLGKNVFRECVNLKKVIIEEGVEEIGKNSFAGTGLKEIIIPSSIKEIDLSQNNNLEKIEINEGNTTYTVDGNCFINKEENRVLYALENFVIPEYITSLGPFSFINSKAIELVIPDHIEILGHDLFTGSGIEKISIGKNLKEIGDYAFSFCRNLREIVIDEENEYLEEIPSLMCSSCYSLKNVSIPKNIKTIKSYAFSDCYNLKDLDLNEGLETIEEYAFSYCDSLNQVVLPKTLKHIGRGAFYNCVTSFILYKTIESIEDNAFDSSTIYTDMSFYDAVKFYKVTPTIGYHPFTKCNVVFYCDLLDGYVNSFYYHYGNERDIPSPYALDYQSILLHGFFETSYFFPDKSVQIEVPYRKGYKFKGFSLSLDSNEICVSVEEWSDDFYVNYNHTLYKSGHRLNCTSYIIPNVENDTVLYAVWEKE